MTLPPKPKKKAELILIDLAKRPPPSKAEQIENSQSQKGIHTVVENISYNIAKRAWEKGKEKG